MSAITYGQLHAAYLAEASRLAADARHINESMPADLRQTYRHMVGAGMERIALQFLCNEADRLGDAEYAALFEAVGMTTEQMNADQAGWGARALRELTGLTVAAARRLTMQADI